jgi:small multidrug resistance family-3 protein
VKHLLKGMVASPWGSLVVLLLAAALEVLGDSFFQSGLYRSSGAHRAGWFAAGALVLGLYGLFVNLPPWNFGELLGAYVALFFVLAQVVAKLRFGQSPSLPVLVGGSLIVTGGLIITLWRR